MDSHFFQASHVIGVHALDLEGNDPILVGGEAEGAKVADIFRGYALHTHGDEAVRIGMRVQGVTPKFIKTLQSAGFKPDVDEVIDAKVQGVTPEFIEQARKHGFQNLTIEKLIELKHIGVLDAKGDI